MIKKVVYAFIDASNIIYGARSEGWFIDQKKLFIYLKNKFKISKAYFYYGKDSKDPKKIAFLNKLKTFGYILRVKEIKRFGKRMKANCDVDLTMDMLIKIKEYNKAIVLTGDGDFAPLFTYLISKGKQIIIISSPKRTAKEIRVFAGENHIDFGSLRYFIEFLGHKKGGRP
ncbi:NYN domain-containing protein [Candidatus Roizmanbacteria bacterium]|nr:NYN domain-containing protein [Candidatus Roizmanbacteria bacterium]